MTFFVWIDDTLMAWFEAYISDPLTRMLRVTPFWCGATVCIVLMGTDLARIIVLPPSTPVRAVYECLAMAVIFMAYVILDTLDKRIAQSNKSMVMSPFRPFMPWGTMRLLAIFVRLPEIGFFLYVLVRVVTTEHHALRWNDYIILWFLGASPTLFIAAMFFAAATTKKPPPVKEKQEALHGLPEGA